MTEGDKEGGRDRRDAPDKEDCLRTDEAQSWKLIAIMGGLVRHSLDTLSRIPNVSKSVCMRPSIPPTIVFRLAYYVKAGRHGRPKPSRPPIGYAG